MPWASDSYITKDNVVEISTDEVKKIRAIADACNQWTLDVKNFRKLLVKEGSASLLVEFDVVDKKLHDRIEHITLGKNNATSEVDATKSSLLGLVAGAIILIPWFIGVKSFFS